MKVYLVEKFDLEETYAIKAYRKHIDAEKYILSLGAKLMYGSNNTYEKNFDYYSVREMQVL